MGTVKVRYLVTKHQKGHTLYYWQPSRELQAKGWKTARLAKQSNKTEAAIAEAGEWNQRLDEWYKGAENPLYIQKYSIAWLVRGYKASDMYCGLKPVTKSGYDRQLAIIEDWIGQFLVTDIKRRHVLEKYRAIVDAIRAKGGNGLTSGNDFVKVMRLLMRFGMNEELITLNPADNLRIKKAKPRRQVWSEEDVAAMTDKALAMNNRTIAVAVMLGAFTGQRPADLRNMTWAQYDGHAIAVRQQKTGALVKVRCLVALKAMLDNTPRTSTHVLVNTVTKRPFSKDSLEKHFAEVRNAALPDRKDLQLRDLRRTAVVYLARAGATPPEIASITGHNIDTCQAILNVYFPKDEIAGRNGIAKLEDYREKLGRIS